MVVKVTYCGWIYSSRNLIDTKTTAPSSNLLSSLRFNPLCGAYNCGLRRNVTERMVAA
jgi:hypothetical protein